jgi:nucleoside-diphosphate-sugar epimerase
MSILVTGATGFVGGALVRRLSAAGHEVHILVRSNANRQRLAGLSGIVEHEADLRDRERIEQVVRSIRPRIVCHCAVYGGFSAQNDTMTIFETNLTGTINLLRASERAGMERFVSTGSSSEYGFKSAPMREDDLPEPRGDYGVAKCAATLHCRSEATLKGLPVVILRLFSPYGPWDDPRRFIPSAIGTFLRGESPVLATPRAVRDYLYIDDVLDLYQLVMELPVPPGEIINGGSGCQVSVAEVAERLQRLTGGRAPRTETFAPQRPEPDEWVADISKARRLLGWAPRVDLDEGLSRTIAWMNEYPDGK